MPYELSVNRVLSLCTVDNLNYADCTDKKKSVVADFRRQLAVMQKRLDSMYDQVVTAAEDVCHWSQGDSKQQPADPDQAVEVFVMPPDSDNVPKGLEREPQEHIVGLFPDRMVTLKSEGMEWLVRMRPSVTACALQRPDGRAKLWWSFEGVPANPEQDHRPSEKEAATFLSCTNAMAVVGLERLQAAYRDGLVEAIGAQDAKLTVLPRRIRIMLSDNDGTPFAALVDAMNLSEVTFAEAKASDVPEVAEGAREVTRFVKDVTGTAPKDETISLNTQLPQAKAVITTREIVDPKDGVPETIITGLARSAGMRAGYVPEEPFRKIEYSRRNLRSISAARPLSAKLAMAEGITAG